MNITKYILILLILLIQINLQNCNNKNNNYSKKSSNPNNHEMVSPTSELETIKDVKLQLLTGGEISLKQFKGKIILLNFWATWCPPCIKEMPSLEILYQKLKKQNFVITAVTSGEKKDIVQAKIKELKVTFPILLDEDGSFASMYRISSIPMTFIIDKSGKIIGKVSGERDWSKPSIIQYFEKLINE